MKKILVLVLAFILVFGMIGCGNGGTDVDTGGQENGDTQFDENYQKMVDWEKEYKVNHPNATDEEISQAFDEAMGALENWVNDYKAANPDATDEEIDQAFKEAWGE